MIGWSHSLHSSFELPILRAAAVNVNDAAVVHPSLEMDHVRHRDDEEDDRDVKPVVADRGNIKEETTSPEPTISETQATVKKESSCVDDFKPLDMGVSSETPTTTIRVKENIMSPESSPVSPSIQAAPAPSTMGALNADSNYSGLQLLSDSIERFMATAAATTTKTFHRSEEHETSVMGSLDPPPEISHVASGSNALDVLCAAALYQQVEQTSSPAAPTSESYVPAAASCATIADQRPPHGFQIEFDFRSKLAELQRKYKEKQKELSSLREF
jgi:hypothetical protein